MQSVCRIVEDVQSGRRSARDCLSESFDAIAATDGSIHAFTTVADRDAALRAAETASGPLAGVAVGVQWKVGAMFVGADLRWHDLQKKDGRSYDHTAFGARVGFNF